jgi:TRAP-type C4-dicarboxylate transport system permease small subunit
MAARRLCAAAGKSSAGLKVNEMNFLRRAGIIFDKIIDYMLLAAAVIIVFDALAVSQDVLIRKFFDFTWAPLFEIVTYTLLWMTFLGTTALLRNLQHVKMDSVTGRFKPRTLNLVNFITSCACVALMGLMIFYTIKLTVHDYTTHFVLATVLNPVKWPIEIIIPIGFIMLFFQLVRNAHKFLRAFRA